MKFNNIDEVVKYLVSKGLTDLNTKVLRDNDKIIGVSIEIKDDVARRQVVEICCDIVSAEGVYQHASFVSTIAPDIKVIVVFNQELWI